MFGGNQTLVGEIAGLIVVVAVAAAVGVSKKQTPPKSFLAGGSFRAVVVPTDRTRTVVVTPCDAPAPRTGEGAMSTPGVTTVRLGRATGPRTVLVPRCIAPKGTALNGGAN